MGSKLRLLTSSENLDSNYVEVPTWDSDFWNKVTHYTMTSYSKGSEHISTIKYYHKIGEIFDRLGGGCGYVYILDCESQPGILKIGSTERTPEERIKELNASTALMLPWKLVKAYPVKAPRLIESLVHKELAAVRVNSRREGFLISAEKAEEIVEKIIELSDNAIEIKKEAE